MKRQTKPKKSKSRRRWLIACLVVLLLAAFWYFENYTFTVTTTSITSSKVSQPVTVVQLSDLHGAIFGKSNRQLVEAVRLRQPDLICVTGDMYTYGDDAGRQTAIALMTDLTRVAPVYFVQGEHDQDETYLQTLAQNGVQVMAYRMERLTVNNSQIVLYGINNVYYSDTFNLFREFDKPPADAFSILLAHIPNFEAFNWFGPDLTLCGDTHGGIMQFPFLGPLYCDDQWLPKLTTHKRPIIDKGLFSTYTGHLYVSGGLGNYPWPVRLFNRPEVSVITIQPEAAP